MEKGMGRLNKHQGNQPHVAMHMRHIQQTYAYVLFWMWWALYVWPSILQVTGEPLQTGWVTHTHTHPGSLERKDPSLRAWAGTRRDKKMPSTWKRNLGFLRHHRLGIDQDDRAFGSKARGAQATAPEIDQSTRDHTRCSQQVAEMHAPILQVKGACGGSWTKCGRKLQKDPRRIGKSRGSIQEARSGLESNAGAKGKVGGPEEGSDR